MSIYIFGDSFFEEDQSHKTWMSMLRKSYASEKIENYGQSGAGPHYNLPLICDMILDKKITSDDILICHVSGVTRVNFPWENNKTINIRKFWTAACTKY